LKTLIFIFSFLIVSGLALSQNTSFDKWYDFGAAETGYCVQQTPDSGFVVCGFQGISLFSSKMVVMKTDKNGILQWDKLIGDGSNDQFTYHIINCTTGGYAVVGYKTGASFVRDIYVVRLDNAGDTVWTKQFGTNLIEEGTCIVQTPDNGFAISFWDENDSTGILKIDVAGNIQWWKHFYLYNGANFKNIAVTAAGDFILAGVAIIPAGNFQGIVMKTNSIGDSIWVKNYCNPGCWSDFYELQETNDGNIIAAGMLSPSALWGMYIVKLDSNGDTLWTRYHPPVFTDEMTSIQQCTDGGYIVGGTTYDPATSDPSMYLAKVDQFGDTIWTKQFGGPDADYGYFVRQTFDGGYVSVGTTTNWDPTGAGIYLVKTDSTGAVITGVDENFNNGNLDFNIYPNPTTGEIYLRFDAQSDCTIQVGNQIGQIVFSKVLKNSSNSEILIDLSFLKSGIYYLKIDDKKSRAVKKLVKID